MKKIKFIFLALILALSTSCSKSQNSVTLQTSQPSVKDIPSREIISLIESEYSRFTTTAYEGETGETLSERFYDLDIETLSKALFAIQLGKRIDENFIFTEKPRAISIDGFSEDMSECKVHYRVEVLMNSGLKFFDVKMVVKKIYEPSVGKMVWKLHGDKFFNMNQK